MLAAYEKMLAPCWEMLAAYEKMELKKRKKLEIKKLEKTIERLQLSEEWTIEMELK